MLLKSVLFLNIVLWNTLTCGCLFFMMINYSRMSHFYSPVLGSKMVGKADRKNKNARKQRGSCEEMNVFRSLASFPARPLLVCTDRRLAHAILSLLPDIFTTRRVWPNSSKTAQTETGNLADHCGLLPSFSHSFDWTTLTTTTKWMYQRIVFISNYSMSHSQESLTLDSIETKCKTFLMKNRFIGLRIKKHSDFHINTTHLASLSNRGLG